MRRQEHGFTFERKYCAENGLTQLKQGENFDAVDSFGNYYQIKTVRKGSEISLGSFFRNIAIDRNFYLVVAFWQNERSNIVEIHKIHVKAKVWRKLLHVKNFNVQELKEWIGSVSNDPSYDRQWLDAVNYYKRNWKREKIRLRFKRDRKNQKRIQCAINNKLFYAYFLHRFTSESIYFQNSKIASVDKNYFTVYDAVLNVGYTIVNKIAQLYVTRKI